MKPINRLLYVFVCTILFVLQMMPVAFAQKKSAVIKTATVNIILDTIATKITIPFGMEFLPDGRMLVSDRSDGKIWLINSVSKTKIALKNLPEVFGEGQAGMMDILCHPDYTQNGWIYFSYSGKKDDLNGTVVERAKLKGDELVDREIIFRSHPFFKNGAHYGGRMLLKDGYLFITIGERYALKDSAQLLGNDLGKLIRIKDDGTIPADNPFAQTAGARPEIWSYGHRNPQGITFHPQTGSLWESEHGPQGGDEINIIEQGKNYGWPVITYGIDYSGAPIGAGITEKEGLEQPLKYYKPSIGPSGMLFYTSDKIPSWTGNLFIGAMALTHLNRLVIKENKVIQEERIFEDKKWRIRSLKQGPDGFLYIGVDGGMVMRIRPSK
ncbi:MAG: PQQ-dependent sugar dehydrogenase [Chitinophagaceae bacterium]